MTTFKIDAGGVYANAGEFLAREVIVITPDGEVIYNDYFLSDGAPLGRERRCSLGTFARWAARPLTPEENRGLRREEGARREIGMLAILAKAAIEAAPDELIRREFYRRGLDRLPPPSPSKSPARGGGDPPVAEIETSPSTHTGRSKKHRKGRRESTG